MNTLLEKAQKARAIFEYHEDTKDQRDRMIRPGFYSFGEGVINNENIFYNALSPIIREAENDEDTAYQFTVEALDAIVALLEINTVSRTDLEDPENLPGYSEAPIYNSELLDWIAKGTSNLGWVEDALNDFGWKKDDNLIQMIQIGYTMAWEAHYFKVLKALQNM